jgi:hypothetical protein
MIKSIKNLLAIGNTLLFLYASLIVRTTDGEIAFVIILFWHLLKTSFGKIESVVPVVAGVRLMDGLYSTIVYRPSSPAIKTE